MSTESRLPALSTSGAEGEWPARLPTVEAAVERVERITVCTRPFRAAGPRVEAEHADGKLLVHHYGHGGAGWSLSWGTADEVAALVLAEELQPVAVVGCGAVGLTTAVVLQRAGVPVTIYARELPPKVRSSRATGLWSPDSRVALAQTAEETGFGARWERLARSSWATFGRMAERATGAVVMHERHVLSELPPAEDLQLRHRDDPVGFAHLDARLAETYPPVRDRGPGEHPFGTSFCRTVPMFRFDIGALTEELLGEFRERGGELREVAFASPAAMLRVPERVVVNCTGWEAGRLFGDATLTPVRGQIAWLPPSPAVAYSLQWGKLSMVSRPDGTVVQMGASSDDTGWNDVGEVPDEDEARRAVRMLAALQVRFATG